MTTRAAPLGLALLLASACHCGGPGAALWVGLPDAAQIVEVPEDGPVRLVAGPPALDAPVRGLVACRDGAVFVLQEPERCEGGVLDPEAVESCVPPGAPRAAASPAVLLSRAGERRLAFAGIDAGGGRLFTAATPPWAAAEDAAGRIWVTGRAAPVVYDRSGAIALAPAPLGFPTRAVAALPDGRVVVSFGLQNLAVYGVDGAVEGAAAAALPDRYVGIEALAAEPGGTLLVATRRWYDVVTSVPVVLRARLEGATLVVEGDPAASAELAGHGPSALAIAGGRVLAAPALARTATPACGRWLSADLARDEGCAAPGAHRGVAWLE